MRNMYRRTERINEQDVPESQHTIFIRGLPGSVTTAEIRYRDGELFGYPVQLTWFRDIRRYLNHLSKQGITVPPRRRFDDDRRRGGFQGRRNWGKSRSRSVSKSPIRRSRSPSRSRSRSASSAHSSVEPSDANVDTTVSCSPEPLRKLKKSKKERRKKRRHSASYSRSPSPHDRCSERDEDGFAARPFNSNNNDDRGVDAVSDMETSDGELPTSERAFPALNNGHNNSSGDGSSSAGPKKMQIADLRSSTASLLQNTSFTVDLESNNLPRPNIRNFSQLAQIADNAEESRKGVFLPPKEFDTEISDHVAVKTKNIKQELVTKYTDQGSVAQPPQHRQQQLQQQPTVTMHHSGYGGPVSVYDSVVGVEQSASRQQRHRNNLTPPPPAPAQVGVERPSASAVAPSFNGAMTDFKTIQRSILQDVRYKPQETSEKEKVGNFRLSLLSTQKSLEEIRHEKLARLSSELQDKVERKKMQLELSYRHDCETFGLMTRKLIGKDRTLEERLRLALLEIMKDLETEAMKNLDEYIDQMIFLSV